MKPSRTTAASSVILLLAASAAFAQQPDAAQRVAALKASLVSSREALRQYEWIETTVVDVKGKERSTIEKRCYYGADGALEKVPVSAPGPEKERRGLRGRIAEKKKEEVSEYAKEAVELIRRYFPPDPEKVEQVKAAGKLTVSPQPGDRLRVALADYLKPGDRLSVDMNLADDTIAAASVSSTMDSDGAPVTMDATFGKLDTGVVYRQQVVFDCKGKELRLTISNAGYRKTRG